MSATASDDDLKLFAGPNGDAFVERRRSQARLCWPAIVAPVVWFLYRKMYVVAAMMVVAPLALAFIARSDLAATALGAALAVIGAMGERLYVDAAGATIARIRAETLAEDEARAEIARAGGVSRAGAGIGVAITLAMIVLSLAARGAQK